MSNTSRIAKNTLMLYFRHILIMLVSLYTVRVVLETLGAEDYGIYNVVAGVVVLFSFLNGAMTGATQRFLNYALGQDNIEQANTIYSTSLILHDLVGLMVVILAETVGLWFFYTWLNIPSERKNAAFVVYQFSVAATVINILRVPYHATIIAYEKMSFFALLSIIESILKLGFAFLLKIVLFDKLIVYAFLVCIAGIIIFFVYKMYCNRNFEIAHFQYCNDKRLFRQLISFSGWSVCGGIAYVSSSHGIIILINMFFNVTVNAALGIATQVNSAVYQLVSNFQTAFSPQIIKSYASQEYTYFMNSIFRTSKISFYLLYFFVLPLGINAEFVLQVWLKNIPEYVVVFTQLTLLCSLIDAISGPLWISIQATGNIKKYQIMVSCFLFANLPISLLFLKAGSSPVLIFIIKVILNGLVSIWRLFHLQERIELPIKRFFISVLMPILIISFISGISVQFLHTLFDGLLGFIVSCCYSFGCVGSLIYFIGLSKYEKNILKQKIRANFIRIKYYFK